MSDSARLALAPTEPEPPAMNSEIPPTTRADAAVVLPALEAKQQELAQKKIQDGAGVSTVLNRLNEEPDTEFTSLFNQHDNNFNSRSSTPALSNLPGSGSRSPGKIGTSTQKAALTPSVDVPLNTLVEANERVAAEKKVSERAKLQASEGVKHGNILTAMRNAIQKVSKSGASSNKDDKITKLNKLYQDYLASYTKPGQPEQKNAVLEDLLREFILTAAQRRKTTFSFRQAAFADTGSLNTFYASLNEDNKKHVTKLLETEEIKSTETQNASRQPNSTNVSTDAEILTKKFKDTLNKYREGTNVQEEFTSANLTSKK